MLSTYFRLFNTAGLHLVYYCRINPTAQIIVLSLKSIIMDRDSSLKSLTIVETNFDEVGSSDSDSGLTFEESFASKKYAGSFRLRFSTTDASIHRGKEPTVWENPLARELPVHEETVYLDQRLANEPKQTKAAQGKCSCTQGPMDSKP